MAHLQHSSVGNRGEYLAPVVQLPVRGRALDRDSSQYALKESVLAWELAGLLGWAIGTVLRAVRTCWQALDELGERIDAAHRHNPWLQWIVIAVAALVALVTGLIVAFVGR